MNPLSHFGADTSALRTCQIPRSHNLEQPKFSLGLIRMVHELAREVKYSLVQ